MNQQVNGIEKSDLDYESRGLLLDMLKDKGIVPTKITYPRKRMIRVYWVE